MKRFILATVLAMASASAPAFSQSPPDPALAGVAQDYSALITEQGHFQQSLQALIRTYQAEGDKAAALASYWKAWAAGDEAKAKPGVMPVVRSPK